MPFVIAHASLEYNSTSRTVLSKNLVHMILSSFDLSSPYIELNAFRPTQGEGTEVHVPASRKGVNLSK